MSGAFVDEARKWLTGSSSSHATVKLGLALFPLFALALDMPEDFFADKASAVAIL